ncbi:MAG: hypothetical protein BWZ10_01376 [candidate division BRC1 bacterium ADurb.BinA364]|nr:MAG: hypothetical protein BWZ10_01376 [candidate division BRC1 bacterium ADurb.BinA364]
MRMAQAGRDLALEPETFEDFGVVRQRLRDDLDRHGTLQRALDAFIHAAESALAQNAHYLVIVQPGEELFGHVEILARLSSQPGGQFHRSPEKLQRGANHRFGGDDGIDLEQQPLLQRLDQTEIRGIDHRHGQGLAGASHRHDFGAAHEIHRQQLHHSRLDGLGLQMHRREAALLREKARQRIFVQIAQRDQIIAQPPTLLRLAAQRGAQLLARDDSSVEQPRPQPVRMEKRRFKAEKISAAHIRHGGIGPCLSTGSRGAFECAGFQRRNSAGNESNLPAKSARITPFWRMDCAGGHPPAFFHAICNSSLTCAAVEFIDLLIIVQFLRDVKTKYCACSCHMPDIQHFEMDALA